MMDNLIAQLNSDDMLAIHGSYYTTHISILGSDQDYHFDITQGKVSAGENRPPETGFSLVGTPEVWSRYCEDIPPTEHHELGALLGAGHISVEGDMQTMQSNFMYVRRLLEIWRNDQRTKRK
jgi:hypothetical protein